MMLIGAGLCAMVRKWDRNSDVVLATLTQPNNKQTSCSQVDRGMREKSQASSKNPRGVWALERLLPIGGPLKWF